MVPSILSGHVALLSIAIGCAAGCGVSSPSRTNAEAGVRHQATMAHRFSGDADVDSASAARLAVPDGLLVAHALGSVEGKTYSNSLEALHCNYARGFRWFEVDLALSADGELFCFHPGMEEVAGLKRQVQELSSARVEVAKFAGLYFIPRFSALLADTEKLGDVVLVTDTKGWPPAMLDAMRRALANVRGRRATRVVLQSYGAHDLAAVKQLSREIGGEVLLTLYMSDADDLQVEALSKRYGVVAVVADVKRFTPWLAKRLDMLDIPILVHTINEHREILSLTRAGADGFYTDSYRPYEAAIRDPEAAASCDAADQAARALARWVQRDVFRSGDFVIKPCAQRAGAAIQLSGCDPSPSVYGPSLAVPPNHDVHVTLDVEAGAEASSFWFEVAEKNRSEALRPREPMRLAPNERRSMNFDFHLPDGSPGIETRLGVDSEQDRMLIHGLTVSQLPLPRASVAVGGPAVSH